VLSSFTKAESLRNCIKSAAGWKGNFAQNVLEQTEMFAFLSSQKKYLQDIILVIE
jgi:hypothetical protein